MSNKVKSSEKSKNSVMFRIGIIIIAFVIIFSFVLPLFYPYSETEVFYTEKTTLVNYGEACRNSEYRFYLADEEEYLPDGSLDYIEKKLNCSDVVETIITINGEKYFLKKIIDDVYTISKQEGAVGVVTDYVINFYEGTDTASVNVGTQYAKFFMTVDENLCVYDEKKEAAGELSKYIIRSSDGRDIFSCEQKRELENLMFGREANDTSVYSETLECELFLTRNADTVSFQKYVDKKLINTYDSPSKEHILGTDTNGMDVFARLMYGGRISLTVGILTSLAGVFIGTLIGCISGMKTGATDMFLMQFVDFFDSLPTLPVLLICGDIMADVFLSATVSVAVMIIVLAVFSWMQTAKVIRIKLIEINSGEDSLSADISGIPPIRKAIFVILPKILPQISSFVFIGIGSVILTESSVSFFGLGVRFPYSTWGSALSESTTVNELGAHPCIWISVTFMICITVMGFYLLGESLVYRNVFTDYYNTDKISSGGITNTDADRGNILEVKNLTVEFSVDGKQSIAVNNFSISLKRGSVIAMVGASGCGKSVTADVIMGLISPNGTVKSGTVVFTSSLRGKVRSYDLLNCGENEFLNIRGRNIGYIMQEPLSCFDPLMTVGRQIEESYCAANPMSGRIESRREAIKIIERVGFDNAEYIYKLYPGELSGGMCQRLMAANVLIQTPELIIADEPCSSLDTHSELIILDLLKEAVLRGASLIIITHDMREAKYLTDDIIFVDGKTRVGYETDICASIKADNENLKANVIPEARGLRVCGISKRYKNGKHLVNALDDVSFVLSPGKALGVIGEEGSGKTTLAGILAGIVRPDCGKVIYGGTDIAFTKAVKRKSIKGKIQLVFQHPYNALSKHICVGKQIREVVRAAKIVDRSEEYVYVTTLMRECGLEEELYSRNPDTLSGGQCKRVCIARALASRPDILICDEPLSYLDADLHTQIIQLLRMLAKKYSMSLIFITHNMDSLRYICDEIMVLENGRIVEFDTACNVLENPKSSCAKRMLEENNLLKNNIS